MVQSSLKNTADVSNSDGGSAGLGSGHLFTLFNLQSILSISLYSSTSFRCFDDIAFILLLLHTGQGVRAGC